MSQNTSQAARPRGDDEHPELSSRNARSGLWLFAIYCAAYAVFIELAVAFPEVMGKVTPLGINLAVAYGLGLIAGAVVLALVYMLLCTWNAARVRAGGSQ